MALRVRRISTHCRIPRGRDAAAALIEDVARDELPRTLAARLGPSLQRQAEVVRLKRLDLTLRIDIATLRRGAFADLWADALAKSLHEALARPSGEAFGVMAYPTRADYLAELALTILERRSAPKWRFPELPPDGVPRAIALLDMLLGSGRDLAETLARLRQAGRLAAVLALLDEVGLERLLRAASEAEAAPGAPGATLEAVLLQLARAREAPGEDEAAGRRQAVRLWLDLERGFAARDVWNALRLIARLVRDPSGLDAENPAMFRGLPAWCVEARRALSQDGRASVRAALEAVRAVTPGTAKAGAADVSVALSSAGLLLVAEPLRRLGWPQVLRDASPRATQALALGAGMRLLQPGWALDDPLDPAAALLAGLCGPNGDIESAALAGLFTAPPPLLLEAQGEGWPGLLDAAADALAARFAARVRGFAGASREAVARHFLRRPGRIHIDEKRLRAVLSPSPWWVAVHVSGADDATAPLEWLGNRRIEFVLEGL
jgi:hypothetical protein